MRILKSVTNMFEGEKPLPEEKPIAQLGATVKDITLDDQGVTTANLQMDGRIFDTVKIRCDRVKPGDRVQVVFYKG